MEAALGSFWAAVAWHHAYCCDQAKRADSWGFRGVIEWTSRICSSNLFLSSRGRKSRTSVTDSYWGSFKSFCKYSASSEQRVPDQEHGTYSSFKQSQIEMCRFGRPSGHVVASTAAVHVCSLCVLDGFSLFNGWLQQPAMFSADIDELGIIVCIPYPTCSIKNSEISNVLVEFGKIKTEKSMCRMQRDFALILLSQSLLSFFSCKRNTLRIILLPSRH